jgi:SNF2 family DNA or RNA helicase
MTSKSTITKMKRLRLSEPPKWQPHNYQKRAIKFMLERQAAGLLLDPGLGKTSIVLAAFDIRLQKKLARKLLVISPLRPCYLVWPAEIAKWKDFNHLRYSIIHGRRKEEALHADADIYIINPEGLDWLLKNVDLRAWRSLGFTDLAVDELTRFKHSKGKRFKLLKKVLHTFQVRWGLTGTPAPNGLQDLFGQVYVLDEGNALGRYITHYRMNYFFNPDGNGWKWVPRAGAPELIYERLKNLCIRMRAEDYLKDLPQIIPNKIMLELPEKVRQLYDQMEDLMIAKLEEKLVVASNAAAASTKLRQICNGAVYVDDDMASIVHGSRGRKVLHVHDVKLEAVDELLEELQGTPLLLAYEFNHDLDRLLEHYGSGTPFIGSGVSARQTKEIESAWNAGEIPLLLGHPASMGHGLNFQGGNACHVGWFSMFWDLELYDQFIRRVARQGNKAPRVFVHHFMMKDTVDEIIFFAQRRKMRGQNALSEALKEIVRGRRN